MEAEVEDRDLPGAERIDELAAPRAREGIDGRSGCARRGQQALKAP
jgi:hypothetical protein